MAGCLVVWSADWMPDGASGRVSGWECCISSMRAPPSGECMNVMREPVEPVISVSASMPKYVL